MVFIQETRVDNKTTRLGSGTQSAETDSQHYPCQVPPQYFRQGEVRIFTGPSFFFSHSRLDFLFCLGPLFCSMTEFCLRFSCQKDGLTFEFCVQMSSWSIQ